MDFSNLFRRRKPELRLTVVGTIADCGKHTPRTRLGPNAAPEEAWFELKVESARLSDGGKVTAKSVVPAEFSGDVELLERFSAGDSVQIECTTATGRLIASMQAVA